MSKWLARIALARYLSLDRKARRHASEDAAPDSVDKRALYWDALGKNPGQRFDISGPTGSGPLACRIPIAIGTVGRRIAPQGVGIFSKLDSLNNILEGDHLKCINQSFLL